MTTFYRRRKSAGLSWFEKLTKWAWIWWAWTAEPFLRNPIRTIRQWLTPAKSLRDIDFNEEDLRHLTPEERKALK